MMDLYKLELAIWKALGEHNLCGCIKAAELTQYEKDYHCACWMDAVVAAKAVIKYLEKPDE